MKNKKKRYGNLLVSLFIFAFVLVMVLMGEGMMMTNEGNQNIQEVYKFSDGYSINGVNIGGLSQSEAEIVIANSISKKIEGLSLTLNYQNKSWKLNAEDFETQGSAYNVVNTAYKYETSKQTVDPTTAVKVLQMGKKNFEIAFKNIFVNFEEKLEPILKEIEKESVDSKVEMSKYSHNFEITKSHNGIEVDKDKLYADIENQFCYTKDIKVNIETKQISPKITESFYNDKLNLLSRFSTDVSTSKGGRKHNVELALSKFNGMEIKSGEEISFNKITGPQNFSGGYQNAIVIIKGKFTEGVGGGICQASTTLYNALLMAGAEIQEVHKHTLPVGYVELGLDAMVTDGYADLKFKNISDNSLYIKTYVDESRAYVEIYGENLKDNMRIKRRSDFIKTIPHPGDSVIKDENGEYKDNVYYKGQYYRLSNPREGYEVKGYLDYYDQQGMLIESKLIRHEIYQPQKGLVVEGVNEVPEGTTITNDVEIQEPATESDYASTTNAEAIQIDILSSFPIHYNP